MKTSQKPVPLSIIVPTKDRPKLLAAAVQSILAAVSNENIEVIVVDDQSAVPAGENLQLSDPRLRVVLNEATSGASGARNHGVSQARGEIILFLDDDDLMLPGYPDWVCGQTADFGSSAILKFSGLDMPESMPEFAGGEGIPLRDIEKFRGKIAGLGCGFWVKRSVFLEVGGIAEDLRVNEDTDFSIRLLKSVFKGIKAEHAGVMVREHGAGSSERSHLTHSTGAAERAKYFGMILARHKDWLATQSDATRFLLKRQIKLLIRSGDAKAAKAIVSSPVAMTHRRGLMAYYFTERLASLLKSKKG